MAGRRFAAGVRRKVRRARAAYNTVGPMRWRPRRVPRTRGVRAWRLHRLRAARGYSPLRGMLFGPTFRRLRRR